jgi:hypothetical protein
MTRQRIAKLLHESVYKVIRRGSPLPTVEEFLELPLGGLLPESSPRDWPEFWKEALTAVIEERFAREGYRIDDLHSRIFLRWNRKMRSVRDWIAERIMPLVLAILLLAGALAARAEAQAAPATARIAAPVPTASPVSPVATPSPLAGVSLDGSDAFLEITPLERSGAGGFDRNIRVEFRNDRRWRVEVPAQIAADPANYRLTSDCEPGEAVAVERAVWRGVRDREGFTTGVVLYGPFDEECTYTLMIAMAGVEAGPIEVAPLEPDPPSLRSGFVRFVRFVDQHISGTIDLRTLDSDENRVGVDLRSQLDFPVVRQRLWADALHFQLVVDGLLAFDRGARQAHNALEVQCQGSWLRHYRPWPAWWGRHIHALGIQLAPLGFEGDQNFDVLDYTAGPAVTFSLPLVDPVLLTWHKLIAMPRGFLPPTIRIGYTYLHRVRHGDARPVPDRERLDVELVMLAPLLRPLDIEVRYRYYHDLRNAAEESILELAWKWYVADDTRTAVLLKLVHGALPPEFRDVNMVGIGFALRL